MSRPICPKCNSNISVGSIGHGWFCQSCGTRIESPSHPTKPPIYPVSVIEVACRALEALCSLCDGVDKDSIAEPIAKASACAVRIICDGLLSHEKAIRGES